MGRIGICSKEGEKWHREVVALINIYLKALEALYEGSAQKGFGVSSLDGSPFRWAPQPPMNHRDPKISLGEVEVPR
jgi:transposase